MAVFTGKMLKGLAYFYTNTDRSALESAGLIQAGKAGDEGWKRFNHNFDIFILKLSDEKQNKLAAMAAEYAGIAFSDYHAIRAEHAEWSQATFGDVGPVGPLKHLSKEALEAAENPTDLSEWADMQFLLWDAQRRAGIADEQIIEAMAQKLPVLKARKWPAAKDGEPVLRVKEDELRISGPIHVTAITALAEAGIPADIQELLVAGDPTRGIPPGALAKAIAAISGNASIIEAAEADKWIDVNDKLPGEQGQDSEEVSLFLNGHCGLLDFDKRNGGGYGYSTGFYDAEICCFRVHGRPERFVTHWQPLPAPPAKQEAGE